MLKIENLMRGETMGEYQAGIWLPARPLRFGSLWSSLRDAWLVLVGKAEAVQWPDQRKHLEARDDAP